MRSFCVGILIAAAFAGGACLAVADEPAAEESTVGVIRRRAKEMADLGIVYGRSLVICIKDSAEDNVGRAKVAYVDVMLSLRRSILEVDKLEFADTAEERALKLAYEKFLKVQNDNCRTMGLEYLDIVLDEELTETERRDKLLKVIERQAAIEKTHFETLDAAVRAVTSKSGTDKPSADKTSAVPASADKTGDKTGENKEVDDK
jgi:hypothetical protein